MYVLFQHVRRDCGKLAEKNCFVLEMMYTDVVRGLFVMPFLFILTVLGRSGAWNSTGVVVSLSKIRFTACLQFLQVKIPFYSQVSAVFILFLIKKKRNIRSGVCIDLQHVSFHY